MKTGNLFMAGKRLVLAYCLLAGSLVFAYFPVFKGLIGVWSAQDEYSHGFLILPISAYISWRKREELAEDRVQPSGWGLLVVVFSLLVYIFAQFGGVLTLASLSFVSATGGLILYLYGFQVTRTLAFPLALLLFMIPVPSQIYSELTMPLQLFVSKASAGIAHLMGLPVYREGNVIHLPGRSLEVVQACSGLRSIVSLLAVSALFAFFSLRSAFLRGFLFVSGVPAAIGANIGRVLIMVAALCWFDVDLAKGTVHEIFGVAVFFLGLAVIVLTREVLSIWDRRERER
jgi:exosortase